MRLGDTDLIVEVEQELIVQTEDDKYYYLSQVPEGKSYKPAEEPIFKGSNGEYYYQENIPQGLTYELVEDPNRQPTPQEVFEELSAKGLFEDCPPPPPIPQGLTRDEQGMAYYDLTKLFISINGSAEIKEAVAGRINRLLFDDVMFNTRDYRNVKKTEPDFFQSRCSCIFTLQHWLDCGIEVLESYSAGKFTPADAFQFLQNAVFSTNKFLTIDIKEVYSPEVLLAIMKIHSNLRVATASKEKGLTEEQLEAKGHSLRKICDINIRLFCSLLLELLFKLEPAIAFKQHRRYRSIK